MYSRTRHTLSTLVATCLAVLPLAGCAIAPRTLQEREELEQEARAALADALDDDAMLAACLHDASAYAVFPHVGKGAIIVGGAYGSGVVFEGDRVTGYCDLSQTWLGFSLGGQSCVVIACMGSPEALKRFRDGIYTLNPQASAVLVALDSHAQQAPAPDVAFFVCDAAGLMVDASLGPQELRFEQP